MYSRINKLRGGYELKLRLRELRKSKGMTQEELSDKSGVTRTTIWKLETGEEEVSTTKTLLSLAKALDCSVGDFFDNNA
jgi:transcriptional regulator with XRE-family HTH domain